MFPSLHCRLRLYFEIGCNTSCLCAAYAAGARRCSDEERREELRQRTRESVVRNPSGTRRASAGPAGSPEEDPRENHVATEEASVQVSASWKRFTQHPGLAGALKRDAGDGKAAVGEPYKAACYLRRSYYFLRYAYDLHDLWPGLLSR